MTKSRHYNCNLIYFFNFIFLYSQIITVELNRGWNCRLGFSLQQDANTQRSVISAIYSDSVAAKDGRLRSGDELLTVRFVFIALYRMSFSLSLSSLPIFLPSR